MLRLIVLMVGLAVPAFAETRIISFAGSDAALRNPERGWWLFAADDFATATDAEIASVADEGASIVYGLVRLDDFRDADLTDDVLQGLQSSFDKARLHGLKVILRFAYNFPDDSWSYADAKDAPLERIIGHIQQLSPVIAANADTVLVMQTGFIGAWGEMHTSSNHLDTPAAKTALRDALYAALPPTIALQTRYPADLMLWPSDRRMGLHNDCFLSSPTDVGTYDEDPDMRRAQRAEMVAQSDRSYFSGEVCDAQADAARMDCDSILSEGALFHLSALNLTYYTAFHDRWKAEGCYAEVSRRMGYRLRLVQAVIAGDTVAVTIANDGWARAVQARQVVLTAYRGGEVQGQTALSGVVSDIGAAEEMVLEAMLAGVSGADSICLSAPDMNPRLVGNPAFSIRFANADVAGQGWDPALAAFCFSGR